MSDVADGGEHARLRESLGAYVLGALDAGEAAELDVHLAGCADCRAELAEIAPAAAALADLRHAPAYDAPAAVPPALEARVLAGVGAEGRRTDRARWLRTTAAAGVAAAVAAVVLVGGLRLTEPDGKKVPLETVAVTDRDPAVDARADLVAHTWGVEVKLHATGFESGRRYLVTVQGTDGKDHPAGEFVGTGSRAMDCNLNSSVLRSAATGFEVRDTAGDVLVTSTF